MDDVINLIQHLINAKYSIDTLDSISQQLNLSKDHILRILRADRYKEYFQLIKSTTTHGKDKIALTLDLFCCTHYAQQCKNLSCPFLHLCPYNIRPMHGKCSNKTCPYDHEVLKSNHNKKLINTRGLTFLSDNLLLELTRVSADPTRSFWVCTDNGKKGGCPKKTICDKLHYCYFALINACTKTYCQHMINDACSAYFRHKELAEYENNDILDAFSKALRQRKPDYISTLTVPPHPSWAQSTSTNEKPLSPLQNNQSALPSFDDPPPSPSIRSVLSATAPEYNAKNVSKSDLPLPSSEHEQDTLLIDSSDEHELAEVEHHLTQEIGYPIKLFISKMILSEYKTTQCHMNSLTPVYSYCPVENIQEICQLLRSQNDPNPFSKPLIIYSSIRDAHEATEHNLETNQFCLLRVLLFQSTLGEETYVEIFDSSKISFDRMWIYMYNDQDMSQSW